MNIAVKGWNDEALKLSFRRHAIDLLCAREKRNEALPNRRFFPAAAQKPFYLNVETATKLIRSPDFFQSCLRNTAEVVTVTKNSTRAAMVQSLTPAKYGLQTPPINSTVSHASSMGSVDGVSFHSGLTEMARADELFCRCGFQRLCIHKYCSGAARTSCAKF